MISIGPVLKITSPHHSLINSLMSVREAKCIHLWMIFLGTTRSILRLLINTRSLLFVHGALSLTRSPPFDLKNAGATFQRAMSYAFHDSRHTVQPYLDDLPAHSTKRQDHPTHLREIFLHYRHYHIRLNPHKCVFCVESGRLLGFIVSQEGIHLDPLKVEAILNLPPPASLQQLQSLQGKANFLRRFVPNYAEVAKGFTRLLK